MTHPYTDPATDRTPRTVLIYTSPALGHLYPMMDVALGLRAAGHRVVVQTLAEPRAVVEAAGVEHRPIADAIESIAMHDYRHASPIAQVRAGFDAWAGRAPHEVEDLRTARHEVDPDLLLVDANTWGAAAYAESSGLPWAAFLPYPLPTSDRNVPAFG
ncbi:MAG: hypothetical protein WD336_04975, partial [Trueperaceae bacterium]